MHVGLNLVFLVPGETGGMETYARELVGAMTRVAPDVRLTGFVNRETAEGGPGSGLDQIELVTVPVHARNRIEWVRGEQQLLPGLARRAGVDLVHSLASTAPARGEFRRVTTVHDLHYRLVPDAHFGLRGLGMRVLVPLAVRRSHRIIADSASTAADLSRLLRVPGAKLDVVPLAAGEPKAAPLPEAELRARHGLGDRTILLTASAKRPHKNLARLLDALAAIPPERRPVLLLPGYPTEHEAELRARAGELGIAEDVRFIGWVDGPELEGMYAAAQAFVFPSLYEGFGLPVLEAMRRGLPVACSDRSSLPEVAGEAALRFDPEDPATITAAVERLLGEPELRQRLIGLGREQAARFSWERTAEGTLASYRRALES